MSQLDDDEMDMGGTECLNCGGEGSIHDCGEDSCCCAGLECDDVVCPDCGGTGVSNR